MFLTFATAVITTNTGLIKIFAILKMAPMHWNQHLLHGIKDKSNHIISSEVAVVIADKFPKAKYHYLVLPWENIPTIYELKKEHVSILEEMYLLAINVIEVKKLSIKMFQLGFHAQPSMERLHLHVISKDFVSEFLKTKKHWNSFNTALFIPYKDLYEEVKNRGFFPPFDQQMIKELLSTPLLCNQCDLKAKSFPHLKFHLHEHEILDTSDDE